jgi:hypothetical protein
MLSSIKQKSLLGFHFYVFLAFAVALVLATLMGIQFNYKVAIATFAYLALFQGVLLRKTKSIHIPLMLTGMATDVLLVLFLSITRNAIGTVASGELNTWQYSHVIASTSAVILYFPVFWLGRMRANNLANFEQKRMHRNFGLLAFIFRTIGFALMFTM